MYLHAHARVQCKNMAVWKDSRRYLLAPAVVLFALVVCWQLQCASCRLELLSARWTERDPIVKQARSRTEELKHTPVKKALKDLQVLRVKRQSSQGTPVTEGHHVFSDGYQYARIHYSGQQSNVILVLTYDYDGTNNVPTRTNLYRSINYGRSFTNIDRQLDSSDSDPLLWFNFFISPINKNMMVFPHATEAKMYISLNEGDTWTIRELTPSTINPRSLLWSPTEDNWAVGHDDQNDNLYVTQNLGITWKKISQHVSSPTDYQWAVPDVDPDSSIIYFNEYDPQDRDRGNFTVSLYTQRHPYTNATRQEFDHDLGRHDDFLVMGPYIFAQKTRSSGEIYLLVSYNREPFQEANIPSTLPHQNYLVTHINSLRAMVIIEHTSGQYNLYLSERTGVLYILSLPDVVVENSITDVELLEGINGTLVANQHFTDSGGTSLTRTLTSFDNGGTWNLVQPPSLDVDGNLVFCQPPSCSLHFHMGTSEYARLGVYSQDSAPGIIVAHGSIGNQLSSDPDLYISRDGGLNWEESLAGSWGATVADHGGLIVAAQDYHQDSSTKIKYTCNEGLTWQNYTFGNTSMTVYGIITEPGEHTTVVSLYGVENGNNSWTVVTVNFTRVFVRPCTDDDYYDWRPGDQTSGQACVLGAGVVIERRRVDRCCLNGRDYVREFNFTICSCNSEDFECDYGYERADGFTGPCVRDIDVDIPDPCTGGGSTYVRSSGYRKIAGDVCVDGDEALFSPQVVTCPSASTPTSATTSTSEPTSPSSSSTSSPSATSPDTSSQPPTEGSTSTPTTGSTTDTVPTETTSTPSQTSTTSLNTSTSQPPTEGSMSTPSATDTIPTANTSTAAPSQTSGTSPNNPTSNSDATASKEGNTGKQSGSNVTAIVLGVVLTLTVIIAVMLFIVVGYLCWRQSQLRKRYLHLTTEPQHFSAFNDPSDVDSSDLETHISLTERSPSPSHQDNDDKPLLP